MLQCMIYKGTICTLAATCNLLKIGVDVPSDSPFPHYLIGQLEGFRAQSILYLHAWPLLLSQGVLKSIYVHHVLHAHLE